MPSLRQLVERFLGKAPKQSAMQGTTEMVQGLAKQLKRTSEEECACDEVFELLDQFAEASARGADTSALLPLVHRWTRDLQPCADLRHTHAFFVHENDACPLGQPAIHAATSKPGLEFLTICLLNPITFCRVHEASTSQHHPPCQRTYRTEH